MCEYGIKVVREKDKTRKQCEQAGSVVVDFLNESDTAPQGVRLCKWHTWLLLVAENWDYKQAKGFDVEKWKSEYNK